MNTIHILKEEGRARLGIVRTQHGDIDTPVFMPVGTQGIVKATSPRDLKEMGVRIILANAYHLYLRPGDALIQEMGGIHRFAGWNGAVLTDSGGYQIFSLGVLREIREDGVLFQSHIDGSRHFLTPEKVIRIQENIGADIIMCLDECIPYPSSYEYTKSSVGLTSRWARRCKEAKKPDDSMLFGIVQGGFYKDLRLKSAQELIGMDFNGYALGGLSVGEPKSIMWEMIDTVVDVLPPNKPKYLMGVGFPEDIVEGVYRGIDMFDCVIPTRHARNGSLFTREGRINIKHARYTNDESPIDERCTCYTCRTFSRAYLRHLFVSHELSSYFLNTVHNIFYYNNLLKTIREALQTGSFEAFYEQFKTQWKGGETQNEYSVCNG
ncbi:MAG TPA: tRNA guanosine(34) transglycosylase Tgt [Syntrophorhabdus sp.]|jgi:queuine tRNA-ribosyltransferase|nr:tRNA guanosine(34) transglycosylase Tgt [Syntrophorhabdus sp.]MDI9557326.1 tRNA guanosine(34) transglycosylase Tgt [Pseudomonadota bacterium]OPX97984.1 MAG: Queuine tRNA-ribosyltransferase [Syntrophorhabdus sp. PtaB.Bin027]MBP8745057.1 tRNA guanosine(34) transglycosylase Tgt [Syntrophorhabdus sp.]HNY71075.1 tRNA guanosine(34) transglycosylase Tgt [Syntrophorhabdus sp.]